MKVSYYTVHCMLTVVCTHVQEDGDGQRDVITCCIIAVAIVGVGGLFGVPLEAKGRSLTLVLPPLGT